MAFLETREGRRASTRTSPEARDFIRANVDGWRAVSGQNGGGIGLDRCGLVAHRGTVHPAEYVNEARLRATTEQRFGFTRAELDDAYRQGPKGAATLELRARIDTRFLELREAGGNMEHLARILKFDRKTLGRAMARARAAVLPVFCAWHEVVPAHASGTICPACVSGLPARGVPA